MSEFAIFTLFYTILCIFLIYPPVEFVAAGFTISGLFSRWLGSEDENFINYHIKRVIVTLFTYSCLPLLYYLILVGSDHFENVNFTDSLFWTIFLTISLILPSIALYHINNWLADDYKNHPIATNLAKFCNNNNLDWRTVASAINTEFRRVDKVCMTPNLITQIIATENWILKVTPLNIHLALQSNARLVVKQADTHQISAQTASAIQYLNIEVDTGRQRVENFTIRINATDFKDLQARVNRDITILPNVKFHKTVIEEFVDVFKETIKNNPHYDYSESLDSCIGCMQAVPNVKLQKLCEENESGERCTTCYCKPMWCADCMAKWFASRQESDQQHTWLSSKCSCPMCRSKFCILDVSLLNIVQ